MSDETVIGGRVFELRKNASDFNVLGTDPAIAASIERGRFVESVVPAAPGVWTVRVAPARRLDSVMEEVRRIAVAHHRYEVVGDELGSDLTITDLINIKLRDGGDLQAVCAQFGLDFVRRFAGDLYACRVSARANENPLKVLSRLRGDPRVTFAEPDFLVPIERFAEFVPSSSVYAEQWHLHGASRRLGAADLAQVRAEHAWRVTGGDSEVVVAVMDDGFDVGNPDLSGRIVSPADFTRRDVATPVPNDTNPDDPDPRPDANRGDFHGTPCAGLAIGQGREFVCGIAPGCSWMPVRFNVSGSSQSLILSILEFISARADVLSCSWGVKPSAYLQFSDTAAEVVAALARSGGRRGRGLVMCFAAGNYNLPTFLGAEDNASGLEYYGRNGNALGRFFRHKEVRSGWTEVPGVVVVSAVTARRRKALYSNWGPHVTVCAPSDNWHPSHVSTRPRYGSINVTTAENQEHGLGLRDVGLSIDDLGHYTHDMGGTSAAAPLVAGACALMISANPRATSADIIAALRRSSSKDLDPVLDAPDLHNNAERSGAFDRDGHSPWFGYGLLDVGRAVELIQEETED